MKKNSNYKRGMSFVEMIIAIGIFSIGIAGFSMLFSKTWQGNSFTYELGKASISASQGVSRTVEYIRKARQGDDGSHPIKSASDNDFIFFSDYDKDGITERLHFYKSGSQFIMGYRKPSGGLPKTYATGDEGTRVLAENVVNESNVPIFYYYNKDYPADTVNNPIATPANVWDVRLVRVFLKINILKGQEADNVPISSFVEIRNLSDYDRIGS
jgi:hypothetical protein